MKPLKIMQAVGGVSMLVWLVGTVIAGLAINFRDGQECVKREGGLKVAVSCSNASPLGFGANMLLGATWPISLFRRPVAQSESTLPKSVTHDEFEKSSVGVMYTCMAIAIDDRNTEDANLVVTMINAMNANFETLRKHHNDFMKLAARASADLKSSGLAHRFYEEECKGPISRIRQQAIIKN
jgi:hypothetical protein